MNTNPLLICCEGPDCNAGHSAKDREVALASRSGAATVREEFDRHARSTVSKALALRRHIRVGPGPWGALMFRCEYCNHLRQYGNTF